MRTRHSTTAIQFRIGLAFLIVAIIISLLSGCSKKEEPKTEVIKETPKSSTEQLLADLKANHGEFLYYYDNKKQNRIDCAFGFKGGLDKPDLFKREINKSLNMLPTKANDISEISFSGKSIELAQYTWETPQFKVDLNASAKISSGNNYKVMETDSVFVRLWIEQ